MHQKYAPTLYAEADGLLRTAELLLRAIGEGEYKGTDHLCIEIIRVAADIHRRVHLG